MGGGGGEEERERERETVTVVCKNPTVHFQTVVAVA